MRRHKKTSPFKVFLKKLPVVVVVIAVVYAGVLIKDIEVPTVIPVKDVVIEGELQYLDKNKIMTALTEKFSDGYISADLNLMREVLLQQPWIKDVSLRRKWPANVSVFIEEHKPMAFWNKDSYISESGDVFKPLYIDRRLNLPQLNGPETQHVNVLKFMNVLYNQMALINFEVKRLSLDERRSWQLTIVERHNEDKAEIRHLGKERNNVQRNIRQNEQQIIDVKLGRFNTEKRLQRFIEVIPALSAEFKKSNNKVETIDMRYPNGFAVKMIDPLGNQFAEKVIDKKKTKVKSSRNEEVTGLIDNQAEGKVSFTHRNEKESAKESVSRV